MELISLELQPPFSMSRRMAREAYLVDRGKTLSLDQTVWTEGMNIELFLFLFLLYNHWSLLKSTWIHHIGRSWGWVQGPRPPLYFYAKLEPAEPKKNIFFSSWVHLFPQSPGKYGPFTYLIICICYFAQTMDNRKTFFYYQWHGSSPL